MSLTPVCIQAQSIAQRHEYQEVASFAPILKATYHTRQHIINWTWEMLRTTEQQMRKEIIKTLIWVVCHFYFLKLLQSFAQSILVAQNLFNFIGSGWK